MSLLQFAQIATVAATAMNQLVDVAPIGQIAHIAVVDKEVGLELATGGHARLGFLLGEVGIDGIELQAALAAKRYGLVEQFAFANGPKDQTMVILLQALEGGDGEREFLAYLRVTMFDNGSVEIYCYQHIGIM